MVMGTKGHRLEAPQNEKPEHAAQSLYDEGKQEL
jgi:hypothetical protein